MEKLAKGHVIQVSGEIMLPCEATWDEAIEWIEFELGVNGSASSENPLLNHSLEIDGLAEIEDQRVVRRYERFDERKNDDGSVTYRRRRIETAA